jgi:hypothetical protein
MQTNQKMFDQVERTKKQESIAKDRESIFYSFGDSHMA